MDVDEIVLDSTYDTLGTTSPLGGSGGSGKSSRRIRFELGDSSSNKLGAGQAKKNIY